MIYPLKVKTTKKFIEELYNCEEGREQDAINAREDNDLESIRLNEYEVVFGDFHSRHKTIIEVRNKEELAELWYAVASGTIGLYACTAANNFLDKIREYALVECPSVVEQWPSQRCA